MNYMFHLQLVICSFRIVCNIVQHDHMYISVSSINTPIKHQCEIEKALTALFSLLVMWMGGCNDG